MKKMSFLKIILIIIALIWGWGQTGCNHMHEWQTQNSNVATISKFENVIKIRNGVWKNDLTIFVLKENKEIEISIPYTYLGNQIKTVIDVHASEKIWIQLERVDFKCLICNARVAKNIVTFHLTPGKELEEITETKLPNYQNLNNNLSDDDFIDTFIVGRIFGIW